MSWIIRNLLFISTFIDASIFASFEIHCNSIVIDNTIVTSIIKLVVLFIQNADKYVFAKLLPFSFIFN